MNNKIESKRIYELPTNNKMGDIIVRSNDSIQFVEPKELVTYTLNSQIPGYFKIREINDNSLIYTNGSIISFPYNDKKILLKFMGGYLNFRNAYGVNGCVDDNGTRPWEQPILTSNTHSWLKLDLENAWKAFNGTNKDENDCCIFNLGEEFNIDLVFPLQIKYISLQNRNSTDLNYNLTSCKIMGMLEDNSWVEIGSIKNQSNSNTGNRDWNEITNLHPNDLIYKIKIVCDSSVGYDKVALARIEIIGNFYGYALPKAKYKIFVISDGVNTNLITTLNETPKMPKDYNYMAYLGYYILDENTMVSHCYPQQTVQEWYWSK